MTTLTVLTLLLAAATVIALVVYLVLIIIALYRAGSNLERVNAALKATADNTAPLPGHLTTINNALATLDQGLDSVDDNLVDVASVLHVEA